MIKGVTTFVLAIIAFMLVGWALNPVWVAATNSSPLPWFAVFGASIAAAGMVVAKR